MLTGEELLALDNDWQVESVDVPESWGGKVYVRTISGDERDRFEIGCSARRGKSVEQNLRNIRARLCSYCLSDENGKPLFADPERAAHSLGAKNGVVLETIWNVARKLNKLNKEDVEDLAKNSESGPQDGSPSA